jgi:hypothetical protein
LRWEINPKANFPPPEKTAPLFPVHTPAKKPNKNLTLKQSPPIKSKVILMKYNVNGLHLARMSEINEKSAEESRCHGKSGVRRAAMRARGTVLYTVVSVMIVLIVFVIATMSIAKVANDRAHNDYFKTQAEYSAKSLVQTTAETLARSSELRNSIVNGNSIRETTEAAPITVSALPAGFGTVLNPDTYSEENAGIKVEDAGLDTPGSPNFISGSGKPIAKLTAAVRMGGQIYKYSQYLLMGSRVTHTPGTGGAFVSMVTASEADGLEVYGGPKISFVINGQTENGLYATERWTYDLDHDKVLDAAEYKEYRKYVLQNTYKIGKNVAHSGNLVGSSQEFGNSITMQMGYRIGLNLGQHLVVNGNLNTKNQNSAFYSSVTQEGDGHRPFIYVDGIMNLEDDVEIYNLDAFCGTARITVPQLYSNIYCFEEYDGGITIPNWSPTGQRSGGEDDGSYNKMEYVMGFSTINVMNSAFSLANWIDTIHIDPNDKIPFPIDLTAWNDYTDSNGGSFYSNGRLEITNNSNPGARFSGDLIVKAGITTAVTEMTVAGIFLPDSATSTFPTGFKVNGTTFAGDKLAFIKAVNNANTTIPADVKSSIAACATDAALQSYIVTLLNEKMEVALADNGGIEGKVTDAIAENNEQLISQYIPGVEDEATGKIERTVKYAIDGDTVHVLNEYDHSGGGSVKSVNYRYTNSAQVLAWFDGGVGGVKYQSNSTNGTAPVTETRHTVDPANDKVYYYSSLEQQFPAQTTLQGIRKVYTSADNAAIKYGGTAPITESAIIYGGGFSSIYIKPTATVTNIILLNTHFSGNPDDSKVLGLIVDTDGGNKTVNVYIPEAGEDYNVNGTTVYANGNVYFENYGENGISFIGNETYYRAMRGLDGNSGVIDELSTNPDPEWHPNVYLYGNGTGVLQTQSTFIAAYVIAPYMEYVLAENNPKGPTVTTFTSPNGETTRIGKLFLVGQMIVGRTSIYGSGTGYPIVYIPPTTSTSNPGSSTSDLANGEWEIVPA